MPPRAAGGPTTATHRFELLDPLRGVAALWVFAFHLPAAPVWKASLPIATSVFGYGHFGVELFFVISGFVITSSARTLATRVGGLREFLHRRLRRVYPPFWASIAVVVSVPFIIESISWFKTGHFEAPSSAQPNLAFLDFSPWTWIEYATLTRAFAYLPDIATLQAKFTGLNAVYWTLAIEVQFYFVMAAALSAGPRMPTVLAGVTVLALITSAITDLSTTGIFLPYWPMFALGVGLFYLFAAGFRPRALSEPIREPTGWLLILTVLGVVLFAAWRSYQPAEWHVGILVTAAIFGLDALEPRYATALRSGTPMVRWTLRIAAVVGAMSYSIYLLHGRLQFLGLQVARQLFAPGIFHDLLAVIVTLVLCYGFYLVAERPFIGRPAPRRASVER